MAPSLATQRSALSAVSDTETESQYGLKDVKVSKDVDLARDLVRIESVTPNDHGCQVLLSERLQRMDFVCEQMNFEDTSNLWAVRGEDAGPLLVFAGHTDVVPTGPPEKWDFPPYDGAIVDGVLHGRGVADMKGGIACFVVACERFVKKHPKHKGSIGLLLTSDEEGTARWGTKEVIAELKRRGTKISMCLVGEPTSTSQLGDTIKIGRRGSLSAVLTIHGIQGHVAYPHLASNPLHNSLGALKDLVETVWDHGNEHFPATTFQISNINGGTGATNVIPGHKTVHFNFRYSPETSDVELKAKVAAILESHELEYDIEWGETAYPYETKETDFIDAIKSSVSDVVGLDPTASTAGGTSDGRFIATTGAQVVELGLINSTIHKINEQAPIEDIQRLTHIYENILERLMC